MELVRCVTCGLGAWWSVVSTRTCAAAAASSRRILNALVLSVDDFRSVSLKLLHSHYKNAVDEHAVSRVEFLPVQWHTALHGDATGVDR